MSKFAGRIIKASTGWYYRSTWNGETFCHDFTRQVSNMSKRIGLTYATPSWGGGVVDHGAERMAIAMLSAAYDWRADWIELANKYYKQYAKEVVANLPDEWTMSGEQIMKWIRKQERRRKKK